MSMLSRRALLVGVAGVAGAAIATTSAAIARAPSAKTGVLRIGVMANLTHAPLLAGLGSGRIAQALAPTGIETRVFRAGPRVTEALIGDALDVGSAGPAAVVVHHARHLRSSGGLRILTGVCSGGASLITAARSNIQRPEDLRGKRVAVTQIGTTQDIALRIFLHKAGLRDAAQRGGDVTILAIAGATILDQMKRGDLHAAWLPEPWATRLVIELGANRFVDERDLWPDRRFSTAVLTSRRQRKNSSADQEQALRQLTDALNAEVARAAHDPEASLREAHRELTKHVGNPGAFKIWKAAGEFVDFTSDPIAPSIESFGEAAATFGLCPPHPSAGLFPQQT